MRELVGETILKIRWRKIAPSEKQSYGMKEQQTSLELYNNITNSYMNPHTQQWAKLHGPCLRSVARTRRMHKHILCL